MANNLYTQVQVSAALLRAEIALYLISKKIQNSFYYLNNPLYVTYKDLQYDIYTLLISISYNEQFVSFDPTPTTYETNFYRLVGALINKLKQVDFTGQFGGQINPNYQNTGSITIVIAGSGGTNYNQSDKIFFGPAFTYAITNYSTLYYPLYGNSPDIFLVTVDATDPANPVWQQDTATVPVFGYDTPNDATTSLVSITWTWGASTSGYIIISGLKPS